MKNKFLKNFLLVLVSTGCLFGCVLSYVAREKELEHLDRAKENLSIYGVSGGSRGEELKNAVETQVDETKTWLDELQNKQQLLQMKCELLLLLEKKENEEAGDDTREIYEKYFQLRQGELARIEQIEDAGECGRFGFLNSHFGGITFEIDEGMYVQYSNVSSILEYLLPSGLILMNPELDLGFMGARAGMDFEEIQEHAGKSEIQKGFMYNEEMEVYYIKFFDDLYEYTFVSDYEDGRDSILIVNHKGLDTTSEERQETSIENSHLWRDAPKEVTVKKDNNQGYKITQKSEKIDRNNFLEYSIVDYPKIEFDDEAMNARISGKINQLFFEKTMLHYDSELEQEINAYYSCDYFVSYADENYVSIYFVECISAGMSSVTTYEDAITISLKTGDIVSLDNFGDINAIMEEIYNYKGTIYTDRVFEVEDWEKNKKEFIEQWKEREDSCYYGYYLYNGRLGILFDHYQSGKVRMGLEFDITEIECVENRADEISEKQIIDDYLVMSPEEFSNKYSRDDLYKKGILYCGMEAWKYQGTQLDAYQEDHYDVADITAIRFENDDQGISLDGKENLMAQNSGHVSIKCFGDYAVSMYFIGNGSSQDSSDEELQLKEISYVKVEMREGTPDEMLYTYLENDYYRVREELQEAIWIESPDGTKEVYVSNGNLPKHPSQIFIRYKEEIPDDIYRRDWQCEIVGWIDDEHLVCNEIDMQPIMIHLESDQVEQIKKENDDYDTYGAKYIIEDNCLISQFMDEEIYRWSIIGGQEGKDIEFLDSKNE